jgi:TRAP-type uncharacterized transport system fused permease subunit
MILLFTFTWLLRSQLPIARLVYQIGKAIGAITLTNLQFQFSNSICKIGIGTAKLKNLYLTFDSHLELLDSFNQPIK